MSKYKELEEFIYNYPTENEQGFLDSELEIVLEKYPDINKEKVDNALMGNTGQISNKGKFINYHHDVLKAVIAGIENRELKVWEWD